MSSEQDTPTAAAMRAADAIAHAVADGAYGCNIEDAARIIDAEIKPLLEACRECLNTLDKYHDEPTPDAMHPEDVAIIARAAIAKAEGRDA